MKKNHRTGLALLFMLAGAVVTMFGVQSVINADASKTWPTVQGKVEASSIIKKEERKDNSTRRTSTYKAEVLFEYSVEGQIYSSNTVAFGGYSSSDPAFARETVNKYPLNSEVTVYYSPEKPSLSVLEPGITLRTLFIPGFGLGFLCAGLAIFLFVPTQPSDPSKSERRPVQESRR